MAPPAGRSRRPIGTALLLAGLVLVLDGAVGTLARPLSADDPDLPEPAAATPSPMPSPARRRRPAARRRPSPPRPVPVDREDEADEGESVAAPSDGPDTVSPPAGVAGPVVDDPDPSRPSRAGIQRLLELRRHGGGRLMRALMPPSPPPAPDFRGRWRWVCCGGRQAGMALIEEQSPDGRMKGQLRAPGYAIRGRLEGTVEGDRVRFIGQWRFLVFKGRIEAVAPLPAPGVIPMRITGTWSGTNPGGLPGDFTAHKE